MKNLGKLFKYDFLDVSRALFPLYIALGVIGVFIRFFLFILQNSGIKEEIRFATGMFQFLLYVGYALTIIAIVIITYYMIVIRYHRSIYGNEGYLTNTLPIETYQIILAKLLTFLSWFFISGVVVFLTFFLIIPIEEIFKAGILNPFVLRDLGTGLQRLLKMPIFSGTIILYILSVLASAVEKILFLFFCVSIANLAKSYKVLIGIGTYIIFGGIINFVKQIIIITVMSLEYSNRNSYLENEMMASIKYFSGTTFIALFLSIGVAIGLFFTINYLLKNKLNLE